MKESLLVIFLIFAILVSLDKGLTLLNIHQVNKNFPESVKEDKYKVEQNPIAKFFFNNFGLIGGTIVYWFFSIGTLFAVFFLLSVSFQERISLYVIIMIYGLIIANNFYFLFKYSGWIT